MLSLFPIPSDFYYKFIPVIKFYAVGMVTWRFPNPLSEMQDLYYTGKLRKLEQFYFLLYRNNTR